MKIRIGVSLGMEGAPGGFAAAVDLLEAAGIDSLWLPEHVYGPVVEPFTGIAFALSRTKHLKAGTGISVLPAGSGAGRQAARVAGGARATAGAPGVRTAARRAFRTRGVPVPAGPGQRAAVFDEALTLLRRLLTADEPVTFEGRFFSVSGASAGPRPAKPLDIWLAGSAPGALRRTGRLADGWLGSLMTPDEAGEGCARSKHQRPRPDARCIPTIWDEHGDRVRGDPGLVCRIGRAAAARRRTGVAGGRRMGRGAAADLGVCRGGTQQVRGAAHGRGALEEFLDGFTRELMPLQT